MWSSQREDPAEPAPAGSSGRVYCLTCEPKLQANAPRCVASRGHTAHAMPSKAREIDARLSLASGHWPFWTLAQRRALVAPGTRRAALDGARNRSINLGGKASPMCDHVQAGTAVPKTKSFASCSSASHRQGCDDRIDRVRPSFDCKSRLLFFEIFPSRWVGGNVPRAAVHLPVMPIVSSRA